MHPTVFYADIMGILDTTNRPIITGQDNVEQAFMGKLLGFPVYVSAEFPVNQVVGSGSGQSYAIFTNPQYINIGTPGGIEIAVSTERFFRFQSGCRAAESTKLISPSRLPLPLCCSRESQSNSPFSGRVSGPRITCGMKTKRATVEHFANRFRLFQRFLLRRDTVSAMFETTDVVLCEFLYKRGHPLGGFSKLQEPELFQFHNTPELRVHIREFEQRSARSAVGL